MDTRLGEGVGLGLGEIISSSHLTILNTLNFLLMFTVANEVTNVAKVFNTVVYFQVVVSRNLVILEL